MPRNNNQSAFNAQELVHPIYLDPNMLITFVAALDNGVSFEGEHTTTRGSTEAKAKEGTAKIKIPQLLSLLGVDFSGSIKKEQNENESESVTTKRTYTEAALFNILRLRLEQDNAIKRVTGDDISDIKAGDLVEIHGEISGDPMSQIIEAFLRIMAFQGVDLDTTQKRNANNRAQKKSQQKNIETDDEIDPDTLDAIKALKDDLAHSPIRDFVLSTEGELKAVLAIARSFANETAAAYMLGGKYRVLGKVTNVIVDEEEIQLSRRTALGLLTPLLVDDVISVIQSIPDANITPSSATVKAPALQILPLAIYT